MKKLFIVFALTSALFSCKKETTNINSTTNTSNGVTCGDNPNINFTSTGTPIGKFSDCIKDVDGNEYKTVTIGTQTWMAENLKVAMYNDGTTIPNVADNTQWSQLTTGAWAYYNNDSTNNAKYGKLYNWYAVSPTTNGNKNVCPTGWHVPTDAEWIVFTDFLGGENEAPDKMKEVNTLNWNNSNSGATNTSLFTALPNGFRYYNGDYLTIGNIGAWWSSSESDPFNAWSRNINNTSNNSFRFFHGKEIGLSI